mmetsp:Transcript_68727/g.222051  ORF Transcript_68727/g.222051 Transcript_68727/m.222051 type:complete len:259 (+) Transcript_68727:807-1583(+)
MPAEDLCHDQRRAPEGRHGAGSGGGRRRALHLPPALLGGLHRPPHPAAADRLRGPAHALLHGGPAGAGAALAGHAGLPAGPGAAAEAAAAARQRPQRHGLQAHHQRPQRVVLPRPRDVPLAPGRLRRVPRAGELPEQPAEQPAVPTLVLPLGAHGDAARGHHRGPHLHVLALPRGPAGLPARAAREPGPQAVGRRPPGLRDGRALRGALRPAERGGPAQHRPRGARGPPEAHAGRARALPGPGARRPGHRQRRRLLHG